MKHALEFPEEAYKDKGKHKISEFEIGTCSNASNVEQLRKRADTGHKAIMETLLEIEVLKK